MDFNTLKYNGKVLYSTATITVAATWFVASEYWGFKHAAHLQQIQHDADQLRDKETLELKVDFLLREIGDVNGRVDRKTQNNIEFFKKELNRLDDDSKNQWDFMNNQHANK